MARVIKCVHPKWSIHKTKRGFQVISKNGWMWVGLSHPTITQCLEAAEKYHNIIFLTNKSNTNGTESFN